MKNGNMLWVRIAAAALALLMAAGYLFCPSLEDLTTVNYSGMKKEDIPTEEALTWSWEPSIPMPTEVAVSLTGKKKAAGMTVTFALARADGTEVASVRQAIDEMGDSDSVVLKGEFPAGEIYTLSLRAEGEGRIRVKGDEDENGLFHPALRESGTSVKRNPVMLFFAAGLFLLALTPVTARRTRARAGFRFDTAHLLPIGVFLLILAVGLMVDLQKPVYEPGSLWQSWDEEIHRDIVKDMTILGSGSLSRWIGRLLTWAPGYLPLAVGETLAGFFTRDSEILYRAGVLMSSLCYALAAALAVKHAPRYKVSFLAAGTLPAIFFQMTCMTYDTVVTGSILLGLALVLESMEKEGPVSAIRAMIMTALLAFGTVAKPAYSVSLFALWMIPGEKLGGKKKVWLFRGFVLLMAVWCFTAVAIPGAYDSVRGGDERFAGANSSEQIAQMLANPGEGLLTPLRFFWEDQDFLMNMGLSQWAYLGNSAGLIELYLILMLVAAPLCVMEEPGRGKLLTAGKRIGFAAIAFGAELILVYTQYIVSTQVGASTVDGMQARYFIPVWIVLLIAIMAPRVIRERIDRRAGTVLAWVVFGLCAWGNISFAMSWLSTL